MKKLLVLALATVLLTFGMIMTANAAEYVYYENDFSNASSLADFTQFAGVWEIVDGQLMLTDVGDLALTGAATLVYTKDPAIKNLTDYILEVDMMNIQTQAGALVRCQPDLIEESVATNGTLKANANYGYKFLIDFRGDKAGYGYFDVLEKWAKTFHVSEEITSPGSNLHLKCIVKGDTLTFIVTDLATGAELYNHSTQNDYWKSGSFGFRAFVMNSGLTNLGMLGYDNLKVTATGAVGDWLASGKALKDFNSGVGAVLLPEHTEPFVIKTPEIVKVQASKLDASKTDYVFYTNDFSDPATIKDFTQYGGKWEIKKGGLYYAATTTGFENFGNYSWILYTKNLDANLLKNYTVEVDLMNSKSSAGIVSHCDLTQASTRPGANGFYGYLSFTADDGAFPALGRTSWNGGWGGNLAYGEKGIMSPGTNYHLKVVHDGSDNIYFTVTALGSNEIVWETVQSGSEWTFGTFGLRMRYGLDTLINLNNAYFDNLKVTVHGPEAVLLNAGYHPNAEIVGKLEMPSTVIKMTLGKTDYTVNGMIKTMDVAPIIRNSRTMLPVRYVAEALGAEILWDGATSTATIKTAGTEIKIKVGAAEATVNGRAVKLDSPAFIENSRTYMPVRFVAETLGATVAWDGATSTATITK